MNDTENGLDKFYGNHHHFISSPDVILWHIKENTRSSYQMDYEFIFRLTLDNGEYDFQSRFVRLHSSQIKGSIEPIRALYSLIRSGLVTSINGYAYEPLHVLKESKCIQDRLDNFRIQYKLV